MAYFYLQPKVITKNNGNYEVNGDDLDNVKRFVLPPLKHVSN